MRHSLHWFNFTSILTIISKFNQTAIHHPPSTIPVSNSPPLFPNSLPYPSELEGNLEVRCIYSTLLAYPHISPLIPTALAAPRPSPSKVIHFRVRLAFHLKALSVGRKTNCLQYQNHGSVPACFNTRHHGLHGTRNGNCQRHWISNHGRLAFWTANFHQTKPSSEWEDRN
jgi:hypothetical protein